MARSILAFALLATGAQSLHRLAERGNVGLSSQSAQPGRCKRSQCPAHSDRRSTIDLIRKGRWDLLLNTSCVDAHFLQSLQFSTENPNDMWERLGSYEYPQTFGGNLAAPQLVDSGADVSEKLAYAYEQEHAGDAERLEYEFEAAQDASETSLLQKPNQRLRNRTKLLHDRKMLRNRNSKAAAKKQKQLRKKHLSNSSNSSNSSNRTEPQAPPRCMKAQLPSFLYIGYGHAGSTTLATMLHSHPELSYGAMKEHHWFEDGCDDAEEYKSQFVVPCEIKQTFEATPGYILYEPHQIAAIRQAVGPNVKIILMFRHPIAWLNSLANDYGKEGMMNKLNKAEDCYAARVDNWLGHFSLDNFLFLQSGDFFKNPQGTLDLIHAFVGVSPHKLNSTEMAGSTSGRRRHKLTWTKAEQQKYIADPVKQSCSRRLEGLTGLPDFLDEPRNTLELSYAR